MAKPPRRPGRPRPPSPGSTPAPRIMAQTLRTARGRTGASQRWLLRQLNDPYVQAARDQGYRSRAAFKLIELHDRFGLIRQGARIIDLGAAPGGWAQVALARGAKQVVALDLLPIDPITGADILTGDFTDPSVALQAMTSLGGPADLVLSDMAPNTTGHAATDHLRIIDLAEQAFLFACDALAPGGSFVAKVFQGGAERALLAPMKRRFAQVRHAKPAASRKESSELYVVAQGFRPETPPADTHP